MGKTTYGQLGLTERIEIYRLHADGKSMRFIARALERSASTISRELTRNSKVSKKWSGGYDPQRAQELMLRRHARGRAHKLELHPDLRKKVFDRLAQGWSPEQIAGRLAKGPVAGRISYESIYRYIYWRAWSFKETLHRLLPRHKHRRGRRLSPGRWSSQAILQRVSIHDRPAWVERRERLGHWEADLMSFTKPGQFLLVAHERKSRRTLLLRQPMKSPQSVADNLGTILEGLPKRTCRSMTFDNGAEFGKHYLLTRKFGIRTWFCDTHSPWQKGSIENAIGRLRRLLPRKTDLDALQSHSLDDFIDRYNNTPRKCLGFKTPNEVFFGSGVALQT
jgi:transposase, IS30 family